MNAKPSTPDKNFDRDIKTYDRQPPKTKELTKLQDQAEKTAGPERVRLDKTIRAKAS